MLSKPYLQKKYLKKISDKKITYLSIMTQDNLKEDQIKQDCEDEIIDLMDEEIVKIIEEEEEKVMKKNKALDLEREQLIKNEFNERIRRGQEEEIQRKEEEQFEKEECLRIQKMKKEELELEKNLQNQEWIKDLCTFLDQNEKEFAEKKELNKPLIPSIEEENKEEEKELRSRLKWKEKFTNINKKNLEVLKEVEKEKYELDLECIQYERKCWLNMSKEEKNEFMENKRKRKEEEDVIIQNHNNIKEPFISAKELLPKPVLEFDFKKQIKKIPKKEQKKKSKFVITFNNKCNKNIINDDIEWEEDKKEETKFSSPKTPEYQEEGIEKKDN